MTDSQTDKALWICMILTFAALAIAETDRAEEKALELKEYCYMVHLHKTSGGENGWPAYKGEERCK